MARAYVIAAVGSALVVVGCVAYAQPFQTYDGPVLPTGETARITGVSTNTEAALFACIDGRSLDHYYGGYENSFRFPNDILVRPGRHRIAISDYGSSDSRARLWLDAVAGHEYAVKRQISGYSVRLYIVDAGDLTPVGGSVGDESIDEQNVKICP